MSHYPSRLTAYADDLAYVLEELFEGLQEMCLAFPIISSATQLHLNFHKTVIVPLFNMTKEHIQQRLQDTAPLFSEACIQAWAKYLGICLGPEGHEHMWVESITKYRQRVLRVKALGQPLEVAVRYYNIYAFSVLQYVAQFSEPSSWANLQVAAGLASATCCPINAMPKKTMRNLKLVGMSCSAADLEISSLAARVRVALASSLCCPAPHCRSPRQR